MLPGCVDVHPRIGIEFHARAIGRLAKEAAIHGLWSGADPRLAKVSEMGVWLVEITDLSRTSKVEHKNSVSKPVCGQDTH